MRPSFLKELHLNLHKRQNMRKLHFEIISVLKGVLLPTLRLFSGVDITITAPSCCVHTTNSFISSVMLLIELIFVLVML